MSRHDRDRLATPISCLVSACGLGALLCGCWWSDGDTAKADCDVLLLEAHVVADAIVNLNPQGQSTPVELRVLYLSDRSVFDALDFFAVWRAAEKELGKTLLGTDSVTVYPGEEKIAPLRAPPDVAFVALVSLFRQPDDHEWKLVTDLRGKVNRCGADQLHIPIHCKIRDNRLMNLVVQKEVKP